MNAIEYRYQDETTAAAAKIPADTVNEQSHRFGMIRGEPLIVIVDALTRYAKAYLDRMDQPLAEDYVLGPYWLDAIAAVRRLLCGDGAVAMEAGRTTDSKDNGAVEAMFWAAVKVAGFTEADLVKAGAA